MPDVATMAATPRASDHSVSFDQLKELKDDLSGRMSELKADVQRDNSELKAGWRADNDKLEQAFHRFAAKVEGLVQGHAVEHKTDQVSLQKQVTDLRDELAEVKSELKFWNRVWAGVSAIATSLFVWFATGGKK